MAHCTPISFPLWTHHVEGFQRRYPYLPQYLSESKGATTKSKLQVISAAMSNSPEVVTRAKSRRAFPRLPPQDFASTEIVHGIFDQSVGNCYGSFSCTYCRQHGKIYVARRAVLFFSNIFGFERRLNMSLSEITEVKLHRATSILISMIDGEDFVFKSLSGRERVVTVVQSLLWEHRVSPTMQPELDITPSSDEALDMALPQPRNGTSRVRAQSCPTEINAQTILEASTRNDRIKVERLCRGESTRNTSPEKESVATRACTENLVNDWNEEKLKQEAKYKERAIDSVTLNWSLSDFFDRFLADDAPHSIMRYQEQQIGDTQVKATKWMLDENDCMTRTISFCHPISNSFGIGPSSTLANREQTFYRFGDIGMCLATTTNVSGVPASDAFHVADLWLVEQISRQEIRFSVLYETVFTKRTIFRRVIEASTKIEIKSWYTGYLAMLGEQVQGQHKADPITLAQNLDTTPTARRLFSIWTFPAIVVAVFALLFQNYMLNTQVRQLHVELKSVQQQQIIALQLIQELLDRPNPADRDTVEL